VFGLRGRAAEGGVGFHEAVRFLAVTIRMPFDAAFASHPPRPRADLRIALPLVLGAALFGALVLLVVSIAATRVETRASLAATQRIGDLRGQILRLDEWLTMSARMAAATGHPQWPARYAEGEPQLDAAIAQALALASPAVAARLAETTDAANRRLVEIEQAALGRVAEGDLAGATALLEGAEYAALKALYLAGMETFASDLAEEAEARLSALQRRAAGERAALVLLLLAGGGLALRWHVRLRAALRQTETVASSDALTGLANRRALHDALEQPARDGAAHAVLMLDLDGFKAVNDAHGHVAGDALLRAVAARLDGHMRRGDRLARLGGDEFAVLIAAGPQASPEQLAEGARALAARLVAALAEPFELGAGIGLVRIGTSLGIALAPQHGHGAEALLHAADLALYRAKQEGRGRLVVFERGMEEASRARAELQAELRLAIAAEAIEPHYQPVVTLSDGRVVGQEMLARWTHPRLGAVPPSEFIPLAEQLGLIAPLTRSLLLRGCAEAAARADGQRLAVNISPLLLSEPDWLLRTLREALAVSGLAPERLEIELTETALVGDLDVARDAVEAIRALGVSVALDDFGTGYSGLRLLSQLPVDRLKIDAGFVRQMHADAASARIVASVIALAQGLGIGVVAEGVEQSDEARSLRALGCEEGQGWLFGRPGRPQPATAAADAA
jgi:diguanylate cyclase (GGDEF)-like protein